MPQEPILAPMGALALWTFLVLLLIPIRRFRAAFGGTVGQDDFKYGESSRVPGEVSIPNRNYMNLLELPVLFYAICLIALQTGEAAGLVVQLAWAYVGLRVLHSLIHLTYNKVMHRLTLFALSNVTVITMWVVVYFPQVTGM